MFTHSIVLLQNGQLFIIVIKTFYIVLQKPTRKFILVATISVAIVCYQGNLQSQTATGDCRIFAPRIKIHVPYLAYQVA